jgi:hypothetical protein
MLTNDATVDDVRAALNKMFSPMPDDRLVIFQARDDAELMTNLCPELGDSADSWYFRSYGRDGGELFGGPYATRSELMEDI